MSLYELFSTMSSLATSEEQTKPATPEEIEAIRERWRRMGLKDVVI